MNRICNNCGQDIPVTRRKSALYCSYECEREHGKKKYKLNNPDTLKGKTSATTGAISELRVAVDLLVKGYNVFRALSPSCPCDLAILKNSQLLKVEVRTTYISTSGKLYKGISKRDNSNNIDLYAWVLPDRIIYDPKLE